MSFYLHHCKWFNHNAFNEHNAKGETIVPYIPLLNGMMLFGGDTLGTELVARRPWVAPFAKNTPSLVTSEPLSRKHKSLVKKGIM